MRRRRHRYHRIPRDPSFDATRAIRQDPYRYLSRRSCELDTDVFETRLFLRRTLCLTGEEAGRAFYDPDLFVRRGAAPGALERTLFGRDGAQGLDGEEHGDRKRLLLSLVTPDHVDRLCGHVRRAWDHAATRWAAHREVELYAEVQRVLARAVCAWAGVPLSAPEADARTADFVALFEAAGSFGPTQIAARRARVRSERWAARRLSSIRSGVVQADPGSAAARIASHRPHGGELLPLRVAARELLDVLRPTVAVSVYVVFVAHALHRHPECAGALDDPKQLDAFVHEVRRFYPFLPAVVGRVRKDFVWHGHRLRAGTRALFDLYGTNHDMRLWSEPEKFRPARFVEQTPSPFALVPQGGGDPTLHHRCPGEGVTVELMKLACEQLQWTMRYRVPRQDLRIRWDRMPALPRSGFRIADVRIVGGARAVAAAAAGAPRLVESSAR